MRVLVVEDNPGDVKLVQVALAQAEGEPIETLCAGRLADAVVHARAGVDAVLLDLSLPDTRGLQTLTSITEIAPDTPVIVLTGNNDNATAFEALRLGAQDYLVKGQVSDEFLVRTIQYAIQRKRLEQTLKQKIDSLKKANDRMLGTEGQVTELKREVNALLAESKRPPRYPNT